MELQSFFADNTMSRDITTMLRVYLEISASSLAQKRDDLQDEIRRLKQELKNTAFHKEQIEELDAKVKAINQVMWPLHWRRETEGDGEIRRETERCWQLLSAEGGGFQPQRGRLIRA